MSDEKTTKTSGKASEKPVVVIVSGSVLLRCNKCGQLLSEVFKLNGGKIKCPYCKSQYLYHVQLQAKKVPYSGQRTGKPDSIQVVVHKATEDEAK